LELYRTESQRAREPFLFVDSRSWATDRNEMRIAIVTTVKTTTTPPYTQLPPDRIELREAHGMIFLPKASELRKSHPLFWEALQRHGFSFRADPAQMDPALFRAICERIGIRIETDDMELTAALLEIEQTAALASSRTLDRIHPAP